jgi:hypothetical protein
LSARKLHEIFLIKDLAILGKFQKFVVRSISVNIMNESEIFSIRIHKGLKKLAAEEATKQNRSFSNYVEYVLMMHLGFDKNPPWKRTMKIEEKTAA